MDLGALVAVVLGGVLVGLADWLFGGVLFHDKYMAYPEVWRPRDTNRYAIAIAQVLGFVTALAFVLIAQRFALTDFSQTFTLALLLWIMAPVPILITNAAFMKLHPLVVASNTVGWLVKLLALAFVTALFL